MFSTIVNKINNNSTMIESHITSINKAGLCFMPGGGVIGKGVKNK